MILSLLLCHTVSAQQQFQFHHINTKGNAVKAIYCDGDGIIWLGTSSGLFSMPQMGSKNPNAYRRPFPYVDLSINDVSGDDMGQLWLRTQSKAVYIYNPKCNEFHTAGPSVFSEWGIDPNTDFYDSYEQESIVSILKGDGVYWVDRETGKKLWRAPFPAGYHGGGKLKVGENGQTFLWHDVYLWEYDQNQKKWKQPIVLPSHVTCVAEDKRHCLWVSTQTTGVLLFDSEGRLLNHLQHTEWDANSLQSNHVDLIYYEPVKDAIWLGYNKGGLSVCYVSQESSLLKNIVDNSRKDANTDVLTFAATQDGKGMWVGLENRGIFLQESIQTKNIVSHGSVTSLYTGRNGELWAGIYLKGLLHKTADGKEAYFFEGKSPYALAEDGKGHLFVALLGDGVWQFDLESGRVSDSQLKPRYIFDLEYHQGTIYAASTEGFYKYDRGSWTKICDGSFRKICIDKKQYIWLLGGEGWEGLTIISPKGQILETPYDLKSAPLKNMSIDSHGRVWIATPAELLMLRHQLGEDFKLERFSFNIIPHSHQVFYNYQASEITADGFLWLGTTTGYQVIDTKELVSQTKEKCTIKRLVMGALTINNTVISPGLPFNGRQLLKQDVVFTKELDLRYNENNLAIECALPYDSGFETDTYFYQLKGFSDVWYPMEGMTIVLPSLPPGDYDLLTRTQSSRESLLTTIHIDPPLWLTWWAFVIYLLILLLTVLFLVRYFKSKQAYKARLKEIKLQQKQQEQMNEMKLRFFTNISHDLRTPLSLIITPVEELLKRKDLGDERESLGIVHRNAENLLSLVNQILDFRRLESGQEKLQLSYGDVTVLVSDVCKSFILKAEKEQMHFSFEPVNEHIETMFDRDKTQKIMMNLLSNAFKFTPSGGRIIVRIATEQNEVVISVADTGVGLSDKDKERVFEQFYQSDETPTASMGSGIGLHIVREYVQLQGGDITVSDNPEGKGTVFRFTIPLRQDEHASSGNGDLSLPLLLFADDNADMLAYMSKGLSEGYRVVTATNGRETLQLLEKEDVDIIVSDVMMPEMDGLELCRRVKTNIETSHIPVILLTAKALDSDELQGLEAGADDYVTKPFSMDILKQRIHNLIERGRDHHKRFVKEIDIEPSEITITSLDEQFIAKAISIVEEHISESEFGVEELSVEMGVHRAQLYKKLEHLTGKSPQQFIRILRLKRGRQLLEQSGLYVSEVAYRVGFNSPRIFSKYFKEEFGVTPKKFIK